MTEAEFQQRASQFTKQLKNYPKVGVRPYGYPKWAWYMHGFWAIFGLLLLLPLILMKEFDRASVLSALFGVFLISCSFAMRVVVYHSAAGGAMDLFLSERIEALEKKRGNGDQV
ncbi:MAG: hypothetical protein ACLQIB_15900 [Isosphaeraceae bacterium]